MKNIRARFVVTLKYGALLCAAWLLSATCSVAAPITVGTFQVFNDPFDPLANGPTFAVNNGSVDSVFPGFAATFADVHLLFDLRDLPTLDFALIGMGPGGSTEPGGGVDSGGLVDPALPDLSTVISAYLTLTLLDPLTNAVLAGTVSLGPTTPSPQCAGCTTRMTDFTDGSMMAIRFDPATAVPEPASLLLVGSGLAAYGVKKRWLSRAERPRA